MYLLREDSLSAWRTATFTLPHTFSSVRGKQCSTFLSLSSFTSRWSMLKSTLILVVERGESFRLTPARVRVRISILPLTGSYPLHYIYSALTQSRSCCYEQCRSFRMKITPLFFPERSEIQPINIVSSTRSLISSGQKFPDCSTHVITPRNHIYDNSFFLAMCVFIYTKCNLTCLGSSEKQITDTSLNCIIWRAGKWLYS